MAFKKDEKIKGQIIDCYGFNLCGSFFHFGDATIAKCVGYKLNEDTRALESIDFEIYSLEELAKIRKGPRFRVVELFGYLKDDLKRLEESES